MTTFTAIAIDPGETSGWAYYRAQMMGINTTASATGTVGTGLYSYEWYDEEWNVGQIDTSKSSEDLILLLEQNHTQEYWVICERFVPRPGKVGAKLDVTPHVIGAVELFIDDRKLRDNYVQQMPAQAKNFVPNATVKKLGLWYPGQKHAMDAMRHLLFWLVTGPYKDSQSDKLIRGWKF